MHDSSNTGFEIIGADYNVVIRVGYPGVVCTDEDVFFDKTKLVVKVRALWGGCHRADWEDSQSYF